jgi:hypothetical protein
MALKKDAAEFLVEFKKQVRLCGLDVEPTPKNRNELNILGMMPMERVEVILELEADDYSHGPRRDERDLPGDVWVFGKTIQGATMYIKLKLDPDPVCLSFHAAEHAMHFPFKLQKKGEHKV